MRIFLDYIKNKTMNKIKAFAATNDGVIYLFVFTCSGPRTICRPVNINSWLYVGPW